MASNAEMRRLILHAADLLRDAPSLPAAVDFSAGKSRDTTRVIMADPILAHAVAEATAEAVLRMVATCLTDDEEPADA